MAKRGAFVLSVYVSTRLDFIASIKVNKFMKKTFENIYDRQPLTKEVF